MTAYYNEWDPYAAQWLRNLIAAGLIMTGEVDERSIAEVQPDDLRDFTRCHFFAGIAGWDYALQLAGWPADRRIWTASCPCQPLSSAGQHKGHADERHLWPAFHRLVSERRPSIVTGEQVASKDGREWLAGIRADLEALGYACGAADLCAAGVGAPHIRPRLYWVADADGGEQGDGSLQRSREHRQRQEAGADTAEPEGLQHAEGDRRDERRPKPDWWGSFSRLGDDGNRWRIDPGIKPLASRLPGRLDMLRGYGNAIVPQVAAEFIAAYLECRP